MVEFAVAAPLGFLLLLGTVVTGIVVLHQVQLNQAVQTSARGVAICGAATYDNLSAAASSPPPATLPNGALCSAPGAIQSYIDAQLDPVSPTLAGQDTVTLHNPDGSTVSWTSSELGGACYPGQVVEVSISYQQPLYAPLLGYALGDGATNTRQLQAHGEAPC